MSAVPSSTPKGFEPHLSAWVSASAGCGKTWLLTRRVLRLLLEADAKDKPPRILCLTFTNAAAAEMEERIHKELAHWAVCDETVLRDYLATELDVKPTQDLLRHAQRLFARILDQPDTVRMLTVHGFCQNILHRFPLEAGLPPHFTVLEGQTLKAFNDELINRFIEKAQGDNGLSGDLKYAALIKGSEGLKNIFLNILENLSQWQRLFQTHPWPALEKDILECHGVEALTGPQTVIDAFIKNTDEAKLRKAIDALRSASKTTVATALKMASWLEMGEAKSNVHMAYAYFENFLTQENEIKKTFPNADFVKTNPDIAQFIAGEAQRAHHAYKAAKIQDYIGLQLALCRLAFALVAFAHHIKQAQAALTFDDLILKTAALFNRSSMADWILYKLDYDVDHLLIDEAQDTSPAQWDVILSLLREFQAGAGARNYARRTLFVVGDEKQSIFSFQGASRDYYLNVRARVIAALQAAEKNYHEIDLNKSYRTAPAILNVVDAVFAPEDARAGVSEKPLQHRANRENAAAYVEVWPLVKPEKQPDPAPWQVPVQRDALLPGEVRIAQRIAQKIRYWLDGRYILKSTGKKLAPGDIMILLERRSRMMPAIVRALKDYHIPVAGVDRLRINEHAAVQDVIALCRFLLLPQDDLALAEVLRGPFIRISDDELFALAHKREGSLWHALQKSKALADVHAYLAGIMAKLDFIEPFALITGVLSQPCPGDALSGLHALTHRVGADAVDPVEELLAFILQQSGAASSTLQGFMRAFTNYDEEIKRDLMKAEGSVRVLSVHGAKGLEAPIVFMPDTMRDTNNKPVHPQFYWNENGLPLPTFEKNIIPQLERAKLQSSEEREEEHQRLLYVALTRARDVLIIGGVEGHKTNKNGDWYGHCHAAMQALGAAQVPDELGESVWRSGQMEALQTASTPLEEKTPSASLPIWARQSLPEERVENIINPSRIGMDKEKISAGEKAGASRFARGLYLHTLLQTLPGLPPERQDEFARHYLQRQGLAGAALESDAQEILRILRDPVFGDVFGVHSQAEVPIVGRVQGRAVSGQIDRLVVTPDQVLVVDFKTNRPPPRHVDAVAPAYLAQMAAYATLLQQLYKGRKIRAALLWTNIPSLMELDETALAKGLTILEKAA